MMKKSTPAARYSMRPLDDLPAVADERDGDAESHCPHSCPPREAQDLGLDY
jgi:hypothetical protein